MVVNQPATDPRDVSKRGAFIPLRHGGDEMDVRRVGRRIERHI